MTDPWSLPTPPNCLFSPTSDTDMAGQPILRVHRHHHRRINGSESWTSLFRSRGDCTFIARFPTQITAQRGLADIYTEHHAHVPLADTTTVDAGHCTCQCDGDVFLRACSDPRCAGFERDQCLAQVRPRHGGEAPMGLKGGMEAWEGRCGRVSVATRSGAPDQVACGFHAHSAPTSRWWIYTTIEWVDWSHDLCNYQSGQVSPSSNSQILSW